MPSSPALPAPRTFAAALCLAALSACSDHPAEDTAQTASADAPQAAAPAGTDAAALSDGTRGGTGRVPMGDAPASGADGPVLRMSTGPQVHLVDAAGMAVYMLEGNTDGSRCDATCEEAWPPVLATASRAEAGTGLDPQLLGMSPRGDQSYQVSYGNSPLYRYAGDAGAGRTNGHGVRDQWGTWSLVGLDGKPVSDPLTQDGGTPGEAGGEAAADPAS